MDIASYFQSAATLVPAIIAVTGFITGLLKLKGTPAQVVSWVVGPVLAFVGMFFNLGMFVELGPIWTGITGVSVALVANGLVSNERIAFVLELLRLKVPKNK